MDERLQQQAHVLLTLDIDRPDLRSHVPVEAGNGQSQGVKTRIGCPKQYQKNMARSAQ